jgi:hypothetical protein
MRNLALSIFNLWQFEPFCGRERSGSPGSPAHASCAGVKARRRNPERTEESAFLAISSPNPQVFGRFQRRAAHATDHGRAVAACERVADFARAVRTVQRLGSMLRICRFSHLAVPIERVKVFTVA